MPSIPSLDITALAALPDHPVILHNHRPALSCETLEDLLRAIGFPVLSGYREGAIYEYADIKAAEVLAAFAAGRLTFNVANSTIAETADPDDRLSVPALIDEENLFRLHDGTRHYRKCLVITQSGGYTNLHVDSGGMAGWMYLYRGRKRWQFWEPVFAPLFYDQVAERYFDDAGGNGHRDPRYRAMLKALPRWDGEIGPGDMLWFPEGWAHRVWTDEDAFGFGGSSLHFARLDQAVHSWLWEKRLGSYEAFDYLQLLRDAAEKGGYDTAPFIDQIGHTLGVWEKNRAWPKN